MLSETYLIITLCNRMTRFLSQIAIPEMRFQEIVFSIREFEKLTKVKSLHNELIIVSLLAEKGPLPSLQIMREAGRSISGHNTDMKRLLSLGIIELVGSVEDRRQRFFALTEKARRVIDSLSSLGSDGDKGQRIGADRKRSSKKNAAYSAPSSLGA